jgi:hypothetical protein
MLRTNANAHQARGDPLQRRPALRELHDPWDVQRGTAAQHRTDDPLRNEHLKALRDAGGKLTPPLHVTQVTKGHGSRTQRLGQNICRRDGILNCEISLRQPPRHGLTLVTRNASDFKVSLDAIINPWAAE